MNSVGGVATDRRLHHLQQDLVRNEKIFVASSILTNSINASSAAITKATTILNDNEFPTLGAKGTASLAGGFSPIPTTSGAVLAAAQATNSALRDAFPQRANYATLMRPDPLTNSEFQIQNEDFPALPGVVGSGQSTRPSLADHLSGLDESSFLASGGDGQNAFGITRGPSGEHPQKGIITHPDGEVTNIPSSMLADQFGMAGLVTYLRTVDNPSIVSLALGYDLTTLGLNLNLSERQLYTTFGGPWADCPIRAHELDAKVPDEYLTNTHIREKLPPVKLSKLSEDVLFYLFYNCPGEVYQLAAACELYQREWRYHKVEGVWLTRSQYGGIKEQTSTYEKGHYNVFDQLQWRKIPKELKLEYKELEERPKLPPLQPSQFTSAMYANIPSSMSANATTNLATTLNNLGFGSLGSGTNSNGGTPPPTASGMNGVIGTPAASTAPIGTAAAVAAATSVAGMTPIGGGHGVVGAVGTGTSSARATPN